MIKLTPFPEAENELFGQPGTPEREEYESGVALALIPETIRAYRRAHGLTQSELGGRVGVQKSQISKLENNARNVTIDTLQRVFSALQIVVKIKLEPAS